MATNISASASSTTSLLDQRLLSSPPSRTTPSYKNILSKPYQQQYLLITSSNKNKLQPLAVRKLLNVDTQHDSYLDDDKPKEECGVVGIYGDPEASRLCYLALHALQHRGQEGAGMVSVHNEVIKSATGIGLVSDVFN